jgi:hypothetical protein
MTIGSQGTVSCKTLLLVVISSVLAMSGCKSGGGQATPQSTAAAATSAVISPSSAPNQAPVISGSPGASVAAGQTYTFVPVATDSDGDSLGFSIENRPVWATFETSTGRLTGTPGASNVGTFSDIRISVSDGQISTALSAFSLTVTAAGASGATGAATLSWEAPTENMDGTALTDLAGYRIYYGTSADALTQEISINTTGTTTYMITDLAPATYYFAIKAFTSSGAESSLSGIASKTIS